MGTLKLSAIEQSVCAAIQHGDRIVLGEKDEVNAEVLRHIVVGLPLVAKADGVWTTLASFLRKPPEGVRCTRTGVGIRIEGGIVKERLDLSAVIGDDGGPIPALEFNKTEFQGGFSGAHGHFARLSFRKCTFRNDPSSLHPVSGRPRPTIDLSGAGLDGDLDMRGVRPAGAEDQLSIRGTGMRVDGEVDLSRCHLRAPRSSRLRRICEEGDDALNFTLAEIKGDLQFLNGSRSEGRIKLRAAHIEGDLWMSGAEIEGFADEEALFLQGARIDGFLMMDGRWDYVGSRGPFRRFRCRGALNLRAAQIGRDLQIDNAAIEGDVEAYGLTVADDVILGADIGGDTDLSGCRIGGTLDISDLGLVASARRFSLKDGCIGRSLKLISSEADYRLIRIRSFPLRSLPGAELLETLWRHEPAHEGADPTGSLVRAPDESVALDRQLVQAGFIRYRGVLLHLDRHADIRLRVASWFGADCELAADALLGLCQPYSFAKEERFESRDQSAPLLARLGSAPSAPDSDGAQRPADNPFRFKGGVILPPLLPPDKMKEIVRAGGWLTEAALEGKRELDCHGHYQELLGFHVQPRALLQGEIDLENLSCDSLDDQAGRGWGTHLDKIEMNHFTYSRTTWERSESARPRELSFCRADSGRGRLARLGGRLVTRPFARLASAGRRLLARWREHLNARLKRLLAERLPIWGAWLFDCAELLRTGKHWTSIDTKRNWIYRQFDTRGLASSSKYKIHSSEYRSQPFEQIIKVARLEGREDYALYFEVLKERIEWGIFIRRNRAWFLLIGLAAFALWLSVADGIRLGAALVIIMVLCFLPTFANWIMYRGFGYLRRPIRAVCTLILAFLIGWWGVDAADDDGMLVVEVTPVAGLVGDDGVAGGATTEPSGPIIGSQLVSRRAVVSDVRCGERINEALYALDILIPLIDLREEAKCSVGLARDADQSGHRVERWFFDTPVTMWAVLKALYAIAGWFIVSLAILTFAHITRPRGSG